jgi:sulfide-dependent adenosine diphosphate thiazole synthase
MEKSIKHPVSDSDVTKLIIKHYSRDIEQAVESDVIITGGGPAGLTCAWTLANSGFNVTIFERKLSPGGGIWGGAMSFNKIVVQKDVLEILQEADIDFIEEQQALVLDAPVFATKLIAKAASHPKVKLFNLITVVDLHATDDKITGVVVNNTGISIAGLHVDPLVFRARAVLDATGHDAVLANLYARRNPDQENIREYFMNAEKGEEDTINNTAMVAPGLFVCGMAANNVSGGSRMGPLFGGMLISGKKAASLISAYLA